MYKSKKNNIIGIVITSIVLVAIVLVTNINLEKISFIEKASNTIIMPIQNALTYLKNKINRNEGFFQEIDGLKTENEELKSKNSELEKKLREFEIMKSENETLKEYMNLKEKYGGYESIPAYIINKDMSNYSSVVVINAGSKDGVKPNMAVISEKGLVGYVISTTDNTSKVQTILDTATAVSATISTSKDSIIVRGTLEGNNTIKATYIPTEAELLQNDVIETSGQGGIYPKGIRIGTIKEIVNTKNITDRYAIIETYTDFSKLGTVLVIKNK